MDELLREELSKDPLAHANKRYYEVTLYSPTKRYSFGISNKEYSPRRAFLRRLESCNFWDVVCGEFQRFDTWYVAQVDNGCIGVLYALDERIDPLPGPDPNRIEFEYIDLRDPEATFLDFLKEINSKT